MDMIKMEVVMKQIKIGFLGLGVIGAELLNIIATNQNSILKRYGIKIKFGKVFIRDLYKKRNVNIKEPELTTDPWEVINDPDTDIICECVGGSGTEETKEYIFKAMNNGKSVILSSKKVLALNGKEIINLATEKKVQLKYDATVGGGIPIAKVLKECFKGEKIDKFIGILNATSNFIYTKMDKDNLSFDAALLKAQEQGYAENDPLEDINGFDALYKTIILMMFSMNKYVDIKLLKASPFSNIDILDMKYAQELGYRIKPLAIVENKEQLVYRIGACLIKDSHIVANIDYNNNIVTFEGPNTGTLGFYGQGAGSKPTASAMFDDLISILNTSNEQLQQINNESFGEVLNITEVMEYKNNLYWRISVHNKVGMFVQIATILASNNVNIEKIIQKDKIGNKIGIVLLTSSIDSEIITSIISQFRDNEIEINCIIPFLD
jgi:homoserine dehydrogenase